MFKLPGEHTYKGTTYAESFSKNALRRIFCEELEFNGDCIVASYPKTGTFWTKEIVYILQNGGDIESAKSLHLEERCKFLELCLPEPKGPTIDRVKNDPHPWVLHTHLNPMYFARPLREETAKFIIVIRNPKDVLVSYYNFYQSIEILGNFKGTWTEFFQMFLEKRLCFGDFFDLYMTWLPHLEKANVLLVKYEDLKSNILGELQRLSKFILGKSLPDARIKEIANHVSFEHMKENPMTDMRVPEINDAISPFMRKGTVGDWKNYFTPEQSDIVDKMYQDTLEKAGITLRFE